MRSSAAVKTVMGLAMVGAMAAGSSVSMKAAGSAAENLAVGAAVNGNCTIATSSLAFGAYDPIAANASDPLDGSGVVTLTCTKKATAVIALGLGANASGATRQMSDGDGNLLTYELYQDAARTTVWDDDAGTLAAPEAPSKAPRDFTVYGRVPGNQDVPAGSYSDTVEATVNF